MKDGHGQYLSCCEDLLSRLALECVDLKQKCPWANRKDGGNTWLPGENLTRVKRFAAYAWRGYWPGCSWDIRIGDGVQVLNRFGPHSLIVTEISYDPNGNPVSCDTANYGQFHAVNGKPPGPSCRLYMSQTVAKDAQGNWRIANNKIIGRLDLLKIREHELGIPEEQDLATVPMIPDIVPPGGDGGSDVTRVTEPEVRSLKFCVHGDDVKVWQAVLNRDGAGLKVDGIYGQKTKKATQAWQASHGLVADGVVGSKSRYAAGL